MCVTMNTNCACVIQKSYDADEHKQPHCVCVCRR